MIDLLRRADGATIVDLTQATGWLAHTTRAAITGLRKRGYAVTRECIVAGEFVYRISGAPAGIILGVVAPLAAGDANRAVAASEESGPGTRMRLGPKSA